MIPKAKHSSAANHDGSSLLGSVFGRPASDTRGGSSDVKGSSAPAFRRFALSAALAAFLTLTLAPAPASAVDHPFLGTFCGPTGLGTPPCQPSFVTPAAMAVDQSSGDLLVIDLNVGTVSRWHENGTPANFSALGTNVIDGRRTGVVVNECPTVPADCDQTPQNVLNFGSATEAQVAVDNSGTATDGNIYVNQAGAHLIDIFASDGHYLGQLTKAGVTNFGEVLGVAVDENGAVYVGDYDGQVHKFVTAGAFPTNTDNTANFTATEAGAVAAGAGASAGSIFVTSYVGAVTKLDSSTGAVDYVVSAGANTTVSVDPASGHLYVAKGQEVIEYDASGGSATVVSNIEAGSATQGVAVNEETNKVYVTREGKPNVEVYGGVFELTIEFGGTGSGSVECDSGSGPEACAAEYPEGTTVTVIDTADAGSEFVEWNGCDSVSGDECEVEMDAAKTVEAVNDLELGQKNLTINTAGGSGTGSVNCEVNSSSTDVPCEPSYLEGTELKLIPVPAAHSEFAGYNGAAGSISCAGIASCQFTLNADSSVNAPFNLEKHLFTVSKNGTGTGTITSLPAGVSCDPTCTHEFDHGTLVKLTGTPGANTQAVAWTGCDTVNGSNQCEVTMSAAKGVTATFTLVKRNLTVTKNGTGTGTVLSTSPVSPTINCGSECSKAFDHGALVKLTGTPAANSQAVAWTGCGSVNGSNECEVTMSAAKGVTATFDLAQRTLTIAKAGTGSGTVTCNGGACAASYADGTKVTLAASAASGSTFAGFSGGGCSGASPCVVTMSADTTVTATFTANPVVSPPPATCPADPSKCPPPSNEVKAGAAKQQGTAIALKVIVPGPGAVSASGKNLITAKGTAKAASTLTLKLKLTSAGKKQLQKKGKLKIKVKIVFTPTGGTPGTTTKTVTFKSKK